MELIRHIPYFERPNHIQVMANVEPASYIDPNDVARWSQDSRLMREGKPISFNELPPHVICLGGSAPEEEYGSYLYLDTKNNCMVYCNWHGDPPLLGLPKDSQIDLPGDITGLETYRWAWPIDTFFEACERNIRDLKWTPYILDEMQGYIQDNATGFLEVELEEVRCIMRNTGWPGDDWDKNKRQAQKMIHRVLDVPFSEVLRPVQT